MAGGGERAGVAMGHDARALRNERSAVATDGAVDVDVVAVYLLRQIEKFPGFRSRRAVAHLRVTLAHALNRPEQIDRGRAARPKQLKCILDGGVELRARGTGMTPGFQRNAIGSGATDCGGAAHHHVANGARDLRRIIAGDIVEFKRQPPLVYQLQPTIVPAQGLHSHGFRSPFRCRRPPALALPSSWRIAARTSRRRVRRHRGF